MRGQPLAADVVRRGFGNRSVRTATLVCGVLAAAGGLLAMRASGVRAQTAPDRDIVISVPGVPGPYCVYGVEKRLRELRGIERVELLWKEEKIRVARAAGSTVTAEDVRRAVERAEYPYSYGIEP